MAKTTIDKQILDFAVRLDNNQALKAVDSLARGLTAVTKKKFDLGASFNSKSLVKFNKSLTVSKMGVNNLKSTLLEVGKINGKVANHADKLSTKFDAATSSVKNLQTLTLRWHKRIEVAEKAVQSKNTKKRREALKNIQETAKVELMSARRVAFKTHRQLNKRVVKSGVVHDLADQQMRFAKVSKFAQGWDWKSTGQGIAGSFAQALNSLGSKNLVGFAKGVAGGMGGALKGVVQKATHWAAGKNTAAMAAGKGMVGGIPGGILKIANQMSGFAGIFSKIGPLIGIASSALLGMVNLFIGLEASAKKFNRDILETSGTVEYLTDRGGDADGAYRDLSKTLSDIRKSAFSMENLDWGITSEDHVKVLSTLQAEGVSLKNMEKQFEVTSKAADQSTQAIKGFADVTHISIAASRMFGISLDQINQFQAEMMTEMGQTFSDTALQFGRMAKAAGESGIASNKFFAILRGVSSDLSLYHVRLEQVTQTLRALGKVMSPKNAQKYLQVATQGLKNMGEADRIRLTYLAGPGKSKSIVQEDITDKKNNLLRQVAKAVGGDAKDAEKLLGGGKFQGKSLDQITKMAGEFRDAFSELSMDQTEVDKGGIAGVASAAANASAGAQFDIKKAALIRMGASKNIRDTSGIQGFAARQATGISQEEFRGIAKMESALESQKNILKEGLISKNEEIISKLKEAGIATNDQAIESASTNKILATMTSSDKDALAAEMEQKDFAQQTSKAVTSIETKIQQILEVLTNKIYTVMDGIFTLLLDLPGMGDKKGPAEVKRAIWESGDANLKKMFQDSNGNMDVFAKSLRQSSSSQALNSSLKDPEGEVLKLQGAIAKASTDKERKELTQKRDTLVDQHSAAYSAVDSGIVDKVQRSAITDLVKAMLGRDDESKKMLAKFQEQLDKNATVSQAAQSAGMNDGFISQIYEHLINSMGSVDYAKAVLGYTEKTTSKEASQSSTPLVSSAGPALPPNPDKAPVTTVAAESNASKITSSVDDVNNTLSRSGVQMNQGYFRDLYNSVLGAARQALFEYYMYKDISPSGLFAKVGSDPKLLNPSNAYGNAFEQLTGQKNALGGLVTSIGSDGMARIISPAPGEGLASIGRGETILPAGRGGGGNTTVNLTVNGGSSESGLGEMLRREVPKLIYEYKKREKYT